MALKRLFNKIQFFHQNQQLGTYIYSFYGQFCFDIFFSSCEQAVYCTIFNCLQPLCHIVRELNKNTKCRLHLWGKTSAERKNLYLLVGQGIARSVQLVVTLRPFTAHLQRSIWQNCFDLQRLLLLNSIGCKILRPLFFFLEKLNGKIFSHTHTPKKVVLFKSLVQKEC